MNDYVFENKDIQDKWIDFYPRTWNVLKSLRAKMPEINTRTRDLESIIEWIFQENEKMADTLAQVQQFYDVARAEAMMHFYEKSPKQSATLITAQAEGRISQVTYLLGFATNLWKTLDRNGINAASLLKRAP